jgi:nitroreductase
MDVREAIYGRRSVRDYLDQPVAALTLAEIITDAVQAPSGVNRQAWSFVVLQDRARLAEYSDQAKACALETFAGDLQPALRTMISNPQFNIFYNAPALVVICATSPDAMTREDCCLAELALMLSAYVRGLGSCRIGFADAWLKTPGAKAELRIPDAHQPVAAVILGTPRARPPAPGRRPPQITWLAAPALAEPAAVPV